MIHGASRGFFAAINDLLFPPLCLGCKRRLDSSQPPLFCLHCAQSLVFIQSPLCSRCGTPFVSGDDHLCGACLTDRHAFDLARSLCLYRPPLSDLILALKFHGHLAGIATFKTLLTRSGLLDAFCVPDFILPVPLHATRLRERGFNQAQTIAVGCFAHWKKSIALNNLIRHRSTTPQSLLSGKERRQNLHDVFSLADPGRVSGARVLLVDDVYTTGSTVNACSKVLRRAGAKRIEVFTLARSIAR